MKFFISLAYVNLGYAMSSRYEKMFYQFISFTVYEIEDL